MWTKMKTWLPVLGGSIAVYVAVLMQLRTFVLTPELTTLLICAAFILGASLPNRKR